LSPDADRTTLLRRAYLDLIGVPPAPEEVGAFLADDRPDAYERLLDRLLASPHFGERWGRHWLDVAGYADTVGFDIGDNTIIQSEGKWRYRDYVIAAFNQDKPYNRFVTEQLAGDELVDWRNAPRFTPEIRELLIATGFLRTARDVTHEPESNIPLSYYGVLHDTVAVVGNSLLGLTLNCAQCHNHKFDPIPQKDYYRLMALFMPAYNPQNWKPVFPWKPEIQDRGLADISPAELREMRRYNQELDRQLARLKRQLAERRRAARSPADRAAVAGIQDRIAALNGRRKSCGTIQALYDVGPPPRTYRLRRGNFETPGEEVRPGFLSVLGEPANPASMTGQPAAGPSSGRRLALARWLTAPDSRGSALLARALVNRLWQHLFGHGIAPTPENLGTSGEPPTHPELLEWLATDFVRSGWRIKPMLKLMMTSTAYRQASQTPEGVNVAARRVDPANQLLWRMRLRRLEAEVVRDSLLAVAGRLDTTMGGPPVRLRALPDGMVVVDDKALPRPADRWRRSVYLLSRRAYNLSLLGVFDQPLTAVNCPRRDASAVPLQSLTMLNDAFVAEQAEQCAARLSRSGAASAEQTVRTAFLRVLARQPTAAEVEIGRRLLDRQAETFQALKQSVQEARRLALVQLCHTLLNTSEFLYAE
jgi:hypothetical protein